MLCCVLCRHTMILYVEKMMKVETSLSQYKYLLEERQLTMALAMQIVLDISRQGQAAKYEPH